MPRGEASWWVEEQYWNKPSTGGTGGGGSTEEEADEDVLDDWTEEIPETPKVDDLVKQQYRTIFRNGYPVVQMREYKNGTWGDWEDYKDYTEMYKSAETLPQQFKDQNLSSFEQWLAANGYSLGDTSGVLSSLSTLQQQLSEGPTEEDYATGWERAAETMGLSGEELTNAISEMTNELALGVGEQQGLTAEELDLRERAKNSALRETEQYNTTLIDNILSNSGSRARALEKSTQALESISDQQLQYDLAIQQEDSERRQAEYDSKLQLWTQMVEQGQMTQQQYLDNVRADRTLALQTAATELSAIYEQNQQYMQMYEADLSAFNTYAQSVYDSINAQLGIDQAAMDTASELYNQALQPYITALTEWETQMTEYAANYQTYIDTELTPYLTNMGLDAEQAAALTGGFFNALGSILSGLFSFLG